MGEPNKVKFPPGGPRDAVYNLLRSKGFIMSDWSDKHWIASFKVNV